MVEQHDLACDVLVAGGGPAGVPCALAAARAGAKVILCQDRPVLGGNASSEVRMHICGANGGRRDADLVQESRESGIIEEYRLETAVRNPQRCATMQDLIFYEMCRAEPNLKLMLNTTVTGVRMRAGRIASAIADRPSTEDQFRISARVFVDCTGDGRLGAEAGAQFRRGRESSAEFNESLAQPAADNKSLGSTLLFTATRHDRPMPFVAPPWVRKFTEDDLKFRHHGTGGIDRGLEYGYWWCEWGGSLDTIKDNETIRDELLAVMLGVWDHIKNQPGHNSENWALNWFGFLPGKRESRRFIGQHVLNENDVMQSRPCADAIAYGGWPIDTHPPDGVDAPDEKPCCQTRVPKLYDIPLRCCVSANVPNLMFAGRNISATHIAFASTRVMATCAVMGQGVGVAAAHAVAQRKQPAQLADNPKVMSAIQQHLLKEGAYLIGLVNDDKADLARKAKATASSHQPGGEPEMVLSGQTRAVHGEGGAPADRARPATHRWMSDPAAGLPAALTLTWRKPVTVKQVRLTFDTGLHRPLTLSHSDAFMSYIQWGRGQEETVRDYTVEALVAGQWQPVATVTGNYQRLRVHDLNQPVQATALRITVTATHGLNHARIMEVRAYA